MPHSFHTCVVPVREEGGSERKAGWRVARTPCTNYRPSLPATRVHTSKWEQHKRCPPTDMINKGGHLATLLVPVVYRYHRGYCTPRGRTFEARLLHNKTTVSAEKGGVGTISSITARTRAVWGRQSLRYGVIELRKSVQGVCNNPDDDGTFTLHLCLFSDRRRTLSQISC